MKYSLIKETMVNVFGVTLFRIKAEKSFGDVSKGDLGGYIEKEENLAQNGNAWIYDEARVFGDARIFDKARVSGNARIYDDAQIFGDARIFGEAQVFGNARIYDDAKIFGDVQIFGEAQVFGNARIYGNAWVHGKFKLEAGTFFGIRYNKEEIKYLAMGNDQELIYKGDAIISEDEDNENIKKKEAILKKIEELKEQANKL